MHCLDVIECLAAAEQQSLDLSTALRLRQHLDGCQSCRQLQLAYSHIIKQIGEVVLAKTAGGIVDVKDVLAAVPQLMTAVDQSSQ